MEYQGIYVLALEMEMIEPELEFTFAKHLNSMVIGNVSFNHYAFGCVGEYLYQYIAGLRPIEPGFKEFEIAPAFNMGIESVNIKYRCIYGNIQINILLNVNRQIANGVFNSGRKLYQICYL